MTNAEREALLRRADDYVEKFTPSSLVGVLASALREAAKDSERLRNACKQLLYHASLGPDEVDSQQWEEDCENMRAAVDAAMSEENQ